MIVRSRPILFSAPMVRAILDGRKTQTRRVVTHPHIEDAAIFSTTADDQGRWEFGVASGAPGSYGHGDYLRCPYGEPGDYLWVRETWSHDADSLDACRTAFDCCSVPGYGPYYRATEVAQGTLKWRPSIFMPRWASRITLEVTEVRVQRLQEISGRDVLAEGVDNGKSNPTQGKRWENMQRLAFEELWNSINGKPRAMLDDDGEPVLDDNERPIMVASRSWASNPWVWAISFRRLP